MPLLLGSANPARILPLAGQMNSIASACFSSLERIATFSLEYGRRTAFGSAFSAPLPPLHRTEPHRIDPAREEPAPAALDQPQPLRLAPGIAGVQRQYHSATGSELA